MSKSLHLCTANAVTWNGVAAFSLQNSLIKVVMVPALGGKIASLIDLRTNREWLWQNPEPDGIEAQYGADYVRYLCGWDECFPSICQTAFPADPWLDVTIPDHGEIWSLPWNTRLKENGDSIELTSVVQGKQLPYTFERTIQLNADAPELWMKYCATNHSDSPMPFIWSSHPTLAASPGDKLILPTDKMFLFHSLAERFGKQNSQISWPTATDAIGTKLNLSVLPRRETATSLKLFSTTSELSSAALADSDSRSKLIFEFDPDQITNVGVWLNFGALSIIEGSPASYCIAIEPCIGSTDDLSLAYQSGEAAILAPRSRRRWQLKVRVE